MLKSLLNKPALVLIIFIILLIGGFYAFSQFSVDIFPNLNYPLINVVTHYSGGSPEDIEMLITKPIENQMSGLQNVRRISSVSRQGLSQVSIEFDWGMKVNTARQLVAQAVSMVDADLPEGAHPTLENLGSNLQEIMGFGLISENDSISLSDLKYLAKIIISNQFKAIAGVQKIDIIGGKDEAYVIEPNLEALIKYKISLDEIKQKVTDNNFQVMAGYIENSHQDYAVRGLGNIADLAELKQIVIKNIDNVPVLLKDVADIKDGVLPERYTVYINGEPGLALSVFKNENASTVKVAGQITAKLDKIKKSFPTGIKIFKYYDQSELINESLRDLTNNILVGGILVFFVLFLLLGKFKNALIVALTIPSVVIIAFIFFKWENLSLNTITLGAIAVAIGMIVDDSVIVMENIERHKESGEPVLQAVVNGVKEIFGADVSGTLTTVMAFLPFVFLPGLAGIFAAPFSLVIITAMVISMVISLTLIPLWQMQKKKKEKPSKPIAGKFLLFLIELNQSILRKFLKHRKVVIIISFLVFLISAGSLVFSQIAFLPQIDEGAILLEYILPPGTSLRESNHIGTILEQIALQDEAVKTVYRRTGSEEGTYQVEPVNRGELVIKLISRKIRKRQITEVIGALKKQTDKIPGVITLYHQVTSEKMDESFSGLPTVFGVTIYGENTKKLIDYADKIEKVANQTEGVGNVINNTKYLVPELKFRPKRDLLARYNLDSKDIMEELRLSLGGETISDIIKGEKTIPIFLKYKQKNNSLDYLKRLPFKVGNDYVPLSKLVDVSYSTSVNTITHINLQREITLPMEVDGSFTKIARVLQQKIHTLHLPNDYLVEFGGQYKLLLDMLKKFGIFALIGMLLIYFIMSLQFGNYVQPFVIMIEIPLSFIGAFIAIALSRLPLNLSFFIGLITLVGVSVNNGIVLIDYINKRRKLGMSREEAIFQATSVRTRPIVLTALTTVLALFPISLGLQVGSKIHQPLAVCVIGGLLVNTILTLNVLPVILTVSEDLFSKKK